MNALTRSAPGRTHAVVIVLALALTAVFPSIAGAQGRCSCNNGCHANPGQCVQRGSSGCEAGFAPFCGTRAGTCPNVGWVSCGGDCTCVRVTPSDGGATTLDASIPTDAPPLGDRPAPSDAPASMDAPVATDRPASAGDVATMPADSPATPSDQPAVSTDGALPDRDASATDPDGGCVCAGGACVGGLCYRERCVYHPELGFTCSTSGKACRLIGTDPVCVPTCAGVSCAAGEFCDERSNGACVVDRCATIICSSGTTCVRSQCGRWGGPDGGVFIADEGDASADGGAAPLTATDDGCGCHAGAPAGQGARRWWVSATLLALLTRSARRRRTASPRRAARTAPRDHRANVEAGRHT